MDRRRLVALLGGLFAAPGLTMAQDLTLVVVLDGDFRPIRSIAAAADLAQFQALWSSRVNQSAERALRPESKIDSRGAAHSQRWLYDFARNVRVLSARKTPPWPLPSPAAFN